MATIVKRAVQYGLKHRTHPPVHVIGIDEVSRRKGQVYLTVVYDLERRVLLWVADLDNGAASLLYPDGRAPMLSPAYDLVATLSYIPGETWPLSRGRDCARLRESRGARGSVGRGVRRN